MFRELQACPNSHLPTRDESDDPKDQNKHAQIHTPTPSSVSSEEEQTHTNSHPHGIHPSGGPTRGEGCKFGYVWSPLICAFLLKIDTNYAWTGRTYLHELFRRIFFAHDFL